MLAHSLGNPFNLDVVTALCKKHNLWLIEDCCDALGATYNGQLVGTFGDIAAFSTMYRKAHMTGGSGGVVYTRNLELFRKVLANADRGKPIWIEGFDDRNPNEFLFPALNFHTDELSCAIGLASLDRLTDTIVRRLTFIGDVSAKLIDEEIGCHPYGYSPADSPFIYPIFFDTTQFKCSKIEFANAVGKEGIGLNPHYQYVVAEWPWVKSHLADYFDTPNARDVRDRTFNLYLNENYGEQESTDVVAAIVKVGRYFRR